MSTKKSYSKKLSTKMPYIFFFNKKQDNETIGKHVILVNERTLRLMIFNLTHHCGTRNPGVVMDVHGT